MKFTFISFLLFLLYASPLYGQMNFESQQLINELCKFTQNENRTINIYAYWFPPEFWEVTTKGNPQVSEEDIQKIKDDLADYLILAISEMDNSLGFNDYTLSDELRNKVQVFDEGNNRLKLIETYNLPNDAYKRVQSFKYTVKKLFGEIGSNLEFMIFDISDRKEQFDPLQNGKFDILIGEYKLEYTLPIGALLPKKSCPISEKLYRGDWKYCPIHGKELVQNGN